MAYAETTQTTEIVLTLSEDEAALLRGALANLFLKDTQFTDDADGEKTYDDLSDLLVGLHEALIDGGAGTEYETYEFEIV